MNFIKPQHSVHSVTRRQSPLEISGPSRPSAARKDLSLLCSLWHVSFSLTDLFCPLLIGRLSYHPGKP